MTHAEVLIASVLAFICIWAVVSLVFLVFG